MNDFAIAVSSGIRPLNNSKLFRKWMEAHFGRDVLEVGNGGTINSETVHIIFFQTLRHCTTIIMKVS